MRTCARAFRRGFTLVELMIVVAVVGILAALSITGVSRYLRAAKVGEARQSVGAISRGAVGAFERVIEASQNLAVGTMSSGFSHDLCVGATDMVPASQNQIQGKKYQPRSTSGADYETGDSSSGWKCLRFTSTSPQYFGYGYASNTLAGNSAGAIWNQSVLAAPASPGTFMAFAHGDLNGDLVLSGIAMRGRVTPTGSLGLATQLQVVDEPY